MRAGGAGRGSASSGWPRPATSAIVNHFVTSASPFGVEARTLGGHWESCGAARFRTTPLVPSPYFEEDGNEVCDCLDRAAWRLGERK